MLYDDIEVGTTVRVGSYRVDATDIVSYARRWDPLPVHTDEAAAKQTTFGGLTRRDRTRWPFERCCSTACRFRRA